VATLQAAQLDIDDVSVAVVFLDPAFESKTPEGRDEIHAAMKNCAAASGLTGNVVLVWQDRDRRLKFIAPPQQRSFFENMSYEQLHAQVNATVMCPGQPR
jgi:hypothetical protein